MNLKQVIAITFSYYKRGQTLPDEILEMYAADLQHLDPRACISAYERWRGNPRNHEFPLPAQIRELVNPEEFVAIESQAREIAARIVGAVKGFGWSNPRGAEKFIGPVGWAAVRRRGGWTDLCESLGSEMSETTFQAQMRDLVEANLRHGVHTIEESIGAVDLDEARKSGDLIQIGRGVRALIPGQGPDGAA